MTNLIRKLLITATVAGSCCLVWLHSHVFFGPEQVVQYQATASAEFIDSRAEEHLFPAFTQIPVFVVEEHHEALPYWRKEKLKDGFLVHFDAHPDMALPWKRDGPSFGVEANDQFIVAASYEGIIDRVLWIWPSWDRMGPRHKNVNTTIQIVDLGLTSDGEMCACDRQFADVQLSWRAAMEKSRASGRACVDPSVKHVQECSSERQIQMIKIEESQLRHAEPWLSDFLYGEGILDIDEDHFGQQLNFDRLYFVQGRLRNAVLSFSCPSTLTEKELDTALRAFVLAVHACKLSRITTMEDCRAATRAASPLSAAACSNQQTGQQLNELWAALCGMSLLSLELLLVYGFCFDTISHSREVKQSLRICSEGRARGEHASDYDTDPSPAAQALAEEPIVIQRRLDSFKQGLQYLSPFAKRLRSATLCRSVRDGYTPRRSWAAIEPVVLSALGGKATFDANLLGGAQGWSGWTARNPKKVLHRA